MYYNVDYEICAAIFLVLLISFSVWRKQVRDYQSKMYRPYVLASFVNVLLDIATCYGIAYHESVPLWINIALNTVFLMIQFWIPNFFMQYVYYRVQRVRGESKHVHWFLSLPAVLGSLCVLCSPLTKWIFYFDATGYYHGNLHSLLYVNAVFYSIYTVVYSVHNRRLLKTRNTFYMCLIVFVALSPTIIQYFVPRYMLSSVGTALAAFIMFLSSENLVTYVDSVTGSLNREAFAYHIRDIYMEDQAERIFVLALDNFKLINKLYGMEGGNELLYMLASRMRKQYSDSNVFRFGGDIFAVTKKEGSDTEHTLNEIRDIIRTPFYIHDMEVGLSACLCVIYTKNHDQDELVEAIDHGVREAKSRGKGQFFEVGTDAVDAITRRKAIEQAMLAQIHTQTFEVHYQPIYDTARQCVCSMEALARLDVPGYGYVSPEEFIRIAEQNGMIVQIGMLVLEEVCRFIKGARLVEHGIEFVEVNLSVVQCMQERISSEILDMLKKYEIDPRTINLEITESAAAYSEERLIRNMNKISEQRISFSLDDYGSGYSNINYIVDLPFSIIKIDKYVVWAAMKKLTSKRILENTIAMFKNIDLKVVAEGIEDEEMARVITKMGADYLQGYYFSKPVPSGKLLEQVAKINH